MLFKSFNIVICSIFFLSACNQLPKDNSKLSLKYLGAAGWEINDENSTAPGEGKGCIDYEDTNDNGLYDEGETGKAKLRCIEF